MDAMFVEPLMLSDLMASHGVRFGTSGARGRVEDLSEELCQGLVMAFLQEVTPSAKKVVLGHDLRPSSPSIAGSCAKAIISTGREVIYAGCLPTPALAYYGSVERLPAVIVTGSHIPFDRNGIKFYSALGEITKCDEEAITRASVDVLESDITHSLCVNSAVQEMYERRYTDFFDAGFLKGARIGVYEHSGVARDMLTQMLKKFGAEVISLGRSDTFVPIDTEAVSEADQAMAIEWANEHGFDAIVSTDGDADRPLIADERGHWLRGDVVGLLCARYLGAKTVVTPVSSNTSIERCGYFEQVIRTRIGSPYVIEGMVAALKSGKRGVVGFEANGGVLLGDDVELNGNWLRSLPTRDAVLPILSLLAMAQVLATSISQLSKDLPGRYTASDRLQDYSIERSQVLLSSLSNSSDNRTRLEATLHVEVAECDLTDGVRLTLNNDEIIHLRPSGNAPELRCYAEADNLRRAQDLVKVVLSYIENE